MDISELSPDDIRQKILEFFEKRQVRAAHTREILTYVVGAPVGSKERTYFRVYDILDRLQEHGYIRGSRGYWVLEDTRPPFVRRPAPLREQILELYKERPQWQIPQITERLGCSTPGAANAVHVLRREGLLVRDNGGYGWDWWLRKAVEERILYYLETLKKENKGATVYWLCTNKDIPGAPVWEILHDLKSRGVITTWTKGSDLFWQLATPLVPEVKTEPTPNRESEPTASAPSMPVQAPAPEPPAQPPPTPGCSWCGDPECNENITAAINEDNTDFEVEAAPEAETPDDAEPEEVVEECRHREPLLELCDILAIGDPSWQEVFRQVEELKVKVAAFTAPGAGGSIPTSEVAALLRAFAKA